MGRFKGKGTAQGGQLSFKVAVKLLGIVLSVFYPRSPVLEPSTLADLLVTLPPHPMPSMLLADKVVGLIIASSTSPEEPFQFICSLPLQKSIHFSSFERIIKKETEIFSIG